MNTDRIDRSDARAFELYRHEVTMAALDGKTLEIAYRGEGVWEKRAESGALLWEAYDYRIAPTPQPTHEAWTFETAPEVVKVRRIEGGGAAVARVYPDGAEVEYSNKQGYSHPISYADLLRDFEQLDGSPCGVKWKEVELEWPKYFVHTENNAFADGAYVRIDSPTASGVYIAPGKGPDTMPVWTHAKAQEFVSSGAWRQIPAHEAHALIAKGGAK